MFIENLDELPENFRAEMVEHEMDGKKGYIHKTDLPLINALKNAKDERNGAKTQLDELNERLSAFEQAKAAEIEAAKQEALEKAKKEGKWEEVDNRHNEVIEDMKARHAAEIEALKGELDSIMGSVKTDKVSALVADLAEMATPQGKKLFKMTVANRVDIDPRTGAVTFLDENGSATSLDLEGFKKELAKDETFSPLLKSGIVTQGGGNVNGSGSGSAVTKPLSKMSESERREFKANDPEGFRRALNLK